MREFTCVWLLTHSSLNFFIKYQSCLFFQSVHDFNIWRCLQSLKRQMWNYMIVYWKSFVTQLLSGKCLACISIVWFDCHFKLKLAFAASKVNSITWKTFLGGFRTNWPSVLKLFIFVPSFIRCVIGLTFHIETSIGCKQNLQYTPCSGQIKYAVYSFFIGI